MLHLKDDRQTVTSSPRWEGTDQKSRDMVLFESPSLFRLDRWLFGFLEIGLNWQWDKPFDASIQNARCRLNCSCPDDAIGTWMDLDNSIQRPLHWGHVVLSEDDDCAFLNVVSTHAPFVAGDQLVQILLMPTVPKMYLQLLDMLPPGEPVEWNVSEISLTQTD